MATDQEKLIIIKNTRNGVIYASPKSKSSDGRAAKGVVFQKGNTEVPLNVWEDLKKTLGKEIKSGELVEVTVEKDNGQSGAAKKVVKSNAEFKDLSTDEQLEVISETMDTKTLKKWAKMKKLDAAVVVAAKEQIEKIENWTPDSEGEE